MKMLKMNLLKAYSKTLESTAFFTDLSLYLDRLRIDCPFLPNPTTAAILDNYYYYAHSGEKNISRLLSNFYDEETETLSHRDDIASMFWTLHGNNLLRQWANYTADYEPLENYNLTATETETNSGNERKNYTGTVSDSGGGSISNSAYGFDSSTAVDTDETTETRTNTRTFNNGETDSKSGNRSRTENRSGNVGVTTSQQMLLSDIELWQWNFYNKFLFPLVDSVLTLPIY